jgi:undecaprenyl-diphosphatase
VIAVVLALAWRRPGVLVLTAAAVVTSDLLARALKGVVGVERPSSRYVHPKPLVSPPHDHSFPSGHAATSFAAATILTAAVPRLAPVWFLLALAIAYSRIYVGVHYPLDVIGGAALGALVATALLLLARARRRSREATRSG